MRKLIARIIVSLLLLAMSAECSGSGSGSAPSQGSMTVDPTRAPWSATVVQPVTPIVLAPGQTIVIVIQLVPINGFVFTSPVFFNAFTFVNPNLVFACPGVVTVGAPAVGGIVPIGIPTVVFPISPIGFGSCVIPINAGIAGVIPLNVQISGASSAGKSSQSYIVRIVRGR